MDKTKLLKNIFELAEQGIKVPLNDLPSDISRDVVEKQLLYIELRNLVKNGGDQARINEIKSILNPKEADYVG
jgi:hypothetical protein